MLGGLKFELARMVASAIAAEGGAANLSEKIFKAARRVAGPGAEDEIKRIDERTLKKIAADHPKSSLTASHLRMLDAYFAPRGMSLATRPLLESHSILLHMGRSEKMMFLLGAYPRQQAMRIDLSHWDFKSVTHLVNAMNNRAPRATYAMEEVIYSDGLPPAEFRRQAWFRRIADDTSIIAIGSSRVNHAAEHVLSEMFPRRAGGGAGARPFAFTSSDNSEAFQSAFWLPFSKFAVLAQRRGIRLDDALCEKLKDRRSGVRALIADKAVFASDPLVRPSPTFDVADLRAEFKTYGVVAVQRRAGGGIWVAVCGLSGPATFGSARAIDTATGLLPHVKPDSHSEPLWVVVEVVVQREKELADPRDVVQQQVIYPLPPH